MIMILKYIEWLGLARDMKRYQTVDDFKGDAKPNHLYKFYPDGAVCSDGSPYHALFCPWTGDSVSAVRGFP